MLTILLILAFAAALGQPAAAQSGTRDLENMLYLDLGSGRVAIRLRPDLAPKHVARVKRLAREKFYDGLPFHRVIAGFMAQTGDSAAAGRPASKHPNLPAEFSDEPFGRGTVGAARLPRRPNSANSQFFICFEAAPWLNKQYTIFGQVVRGMAHVDRIRKGHPSTGAVEAPDRIVRLLVAADASDHSVLSTPAERPAGRSSSRRGSF